MQVSWGAATWPAGHHLAPGTCRGGAVGLGYASWITLEFLAFWIKGIQKSKMSTEMLWWDWAGSQWVIWSSSTSRPASSRTLKGINCPYPTQTLSVCGLWSFKPLSHSHNLHPHLWSLSSPLFWRLVHEQCVHFPYCLMKMFLALNIRCAARLMEKKIAILIIGGSDEFLGSEGGTVMWTIKQASDYWQCIFEEIIAV